MVVRPEIDRRISAVAEDEDDAAAFLLAQAGDGLVDGVPERRRPDRLQAGPEDTDHLLLIAREVRRLDRDAFGEAADARLVARLEPAHERFGGRHDEAEVAAHAAAAVEHHHHGDGLHVIREDGDRLRLAVVADLEILAREVRDQPAVADR